jgi:hypothetical protein
MSLMTQSLLPPTTEDAELSAETGWPDVARAIRSILFSHLLSILLFAEVIALVVYLATNHQEPGKHHKGPTPAELRLEVLAMVGLAVFVLGQFFAVVMAVRGQWTCLLRSPERCHAKWLMFACILFILISPTAGFFSGFLAATDPDAVVEAGKKKKKDPQTFTEMVGGLEEYKETRHLQTTSGLLQLTSVALSLGSSLLFLLYLRAVGRCWESDVCVLLVDLFLFFVGALVAAVILIPLFAPKLMAQPLIPLALGGSAVLAYVWYLMLLLITSNCISNGLAQRPSLS